MLRRKTWKIYKDPGEDFASNFAEEFKQDLYGINHRTWKPNFSDNIRLSFAVDAHRT